MTLRVSIVTPVFNGMPWLPEAIESVAAQRALGVDVEHIVLDGGSTDGSREWLAAHSELGFVPVFEPDRGQTDALVKGFARASGSVFGWVNADDVLEPGALQNVVNAFEANPGAVLVAGVCLLIDRDGRVTGLIPTPPIASFEGLLHDQANPPQPATFVTADSYRRSGGLDAQYDLAMDVDLWLKTARLGQVVFLPNTVLARFRVHADAKSVRGLAASIQQDFGIRRASGMRLRSPAAYGLISRGWVKPALRPFKRVLQRCVRATMRRG